MLDLIVVGWYISNPFARGLYLLAGGFSCRRRPRRRKTGSYGLLVRGYGDICQRRPSPSFITRRIWLFFFEGRLHLAADVVVPGDGETSELLRTACAWIWGHLSMVPAFIWMVPAVQPRMGSVTVGVEICVVAT